MVDNVTKLNDEINEALKTCEVVEIRLTPVAEKQLGEELAAKKGAREKVHYVTSILGIPVVVDSAVPADRMWVLKKRERKV